MTRRARVLTYGTLIIIGIEMQRIADVLFTGGHPLTAVSALALIAMLLAPDRKRTLVRRREDA